MLLNVIIYIENRGDILDFIITFFRDVLDGPLYTGVAITCGILICSCIGYLGEQYLNNQKLKKEYEATHTTLAASVDETNVASTSTTQVAQTSVATQGDVNVVTTNQSQ